MKTMSWSRYHCLPRPSCMPGVATALRDAQDPETQPQTASAATASAHGWALTRNFQFVIPAVSNQTRPGLPRS